MTTNRRLAAIMADVVGYSRLMGEDDERTLKSLHVVASTFCQNLLDER